MTTIVDPVVRGTLGTVAQQLTKQLRPHRLGFALSMFRLDDLMALGKGGKVPHALIATNAKLSEALAVLGSWVDTERTLEADRQVKANAKTNGNGEADTPRRRYELRVSIIDTQAEEHAHRYVATETLGSSDQLSLMTRMLPNVFVKVDDDGS